MNISHNLILPALAGYLAVSSAVAQIAFQEDFSANPALRGWRVFGDPMLFSWNPTNQNLEVTWDSSHSNSYFHRPLGTVLAKDDDFSFSFDLRLRDIQVGSTPGKTFTFQIALGFLNWAAATVTNFFRGTGMDSPNLVEFNYFPDSGYGATFSTVTISSNQQFAYAVAIQELTPEDLFHIAVAYTASGQTLATTVLKNDLPFAEYAASLPGAFSDFRVDMFSISSFSDAGQDPEWDGSVLAHGTVDNLALTVPPPVLTEVRGSWQNQAWTVAVASRTNFLYRLEASSDFQTWTNLVSAPGDGGVVSLQDTNSHRFQFYRVKAERP